MKYILLIIFLFFAILIAQTVAEPPINFDDDNAGSETNPFVINSLANLRWLSETPFYWGSGYLGGAGAPAWINITSYYYFSQEANIDASDTVNWNNGMGFLPIGNSETNPFVGNYQGNGYLITNLYINRPTTNYIALFGYAFASHVKNVNLLNVEITGRNRVSGLIGGSFFPTVEYCTVSGNVTGHDWVGSVVATMGGIADAVDIRGLVNYCISSANVVGYNTPANNTIGSIGGLAGTMHESNIFNSTFSGTVTGNSSVGGIVGSNSYGIIYNCQSTGSVSGLRSVGGVSGSSYDGKTLYSSSSGLIIGELSVGGLIGFARSGTGIVIENSYSKSTVIGNETVGGLVGGLSFTTSIILDSYFYGNLEYNGGDNKAGGLVGVVSAGRIINCYATSENPFINAYGLVGTIGEYSSYIFNCFWDTDATEVYELYGELGSYYDIINSSGKTTEEMKQISTYLEQGWDFTNVWNIDPEVNDGYPYNQHNEVIVFPPPTNLIAEVEGNRVTLSWEEPSPTNIGTLWVYCVYRNNIIIRDVYYPQTYYVDIINSGEGEFTYYIEALYLELAGFSEPSNSVTVNLSTSISEKIITASRTELLGNYPNPFNSETTLSFQITEKSMVHIQIHNIRGQLVKTILNEEYLPGHYNVFWDGKDLSGNNVSSGVYFYTMTAGKYTQTKKMILFK